MATDDPEKMPGSDRTLAEREAMYRSAFEQASVGIAHVGPQGEWLNVNRRVSEIVGYSPSELLTITFQDITHPDDLDLDVNLLNEVLDGTRDGYRIDKRYFHKTGRIVWVTLSVSCVRKASGEVDYFISVLQDITEKKRIGQALLDSEIRFRAVQETSPDGFMIFHSLRSTDGEIEDFVWEFINPAAEQLTGRVSQALIGKRLTKEMPEVSTYGLFEVFCNTVQTGAPWRREVYYPGRDRRRWFNFTVARVGDGFAVSFQDVTARKNAELQLQASQKRLRTILNGVMAIIGLAKPDGKLLEVNETTLRLTGVREDEMLGHRIWNHPAWCQTSESQDQLVKAFEEAKVGKRMRFDTEIRGSGGQSIPVDMQLSPIFDEFEQVTEIVLSAVDISERKRSEAHREMLLSELNHRVKNSLATIQAIAAHTVREATDLEGFRRAFTGRLRAIAASHDLLVSSTRESADISRLIREQIMGYAPEEASRLELSGPPLVLGPQGAHAFGLILHELATNASKYGAFSNEHGCLRIGWRLEGEDVVVEWLERGGPTVVPPTRRGFGSALIEQSLSHSLGGRSKLDFNPEGLKAEFQFPVRK